jgi:hypothetical protein
LYVLKPTGIIPVKNIDRLVFVIYSLLVYCEVGTEIYTSLRQTSGFAGTTFRPTTGGMNA